MCDDLGRPDFFVASESAAAGNQKARPRQCRDARPLRRAGKTQRQRALVLPLPTWSPVGRQFAWKINYALTGILRSECDADPQARVRDPTSRKFYGGGLRARKTTPAVDQIGRNRLLAANVLADGDLV